MTRMLNKPNLPEEIKEAKSKELAVMKRQLKDKRKTTFLSQKIDLKYRKIKFFEKRKIIRKLTQAETKLKKLQQGEDIGESLEDVETYKQLVKDDLNYVNFYPKGEKYISLFPNKEKDDEKAIAKREEMRATVKDLLDQRSKKIAKMIEKNISGVLNKKKTNRVEEFLMEEEAEEEDIDFKPTMIVDKKGRIIREDMKSK